MLIEQEKLELFNFIQASVDEDASDGAWFQMHVDACDHWCSDKVKAVPKAQRRTYYFDFYDIQSDYWDWKNGQSNTES